MAGGRPQAGPDRRGAVDRPRHSRAALRGPGLPLRLRGQRRGGVADRGGGPPGGGGDRPAPPSPPSAPTASGSSSSAPTGATTGAATSCSRSWPSAWGCPAWPLETCTSIRATASRSRTRWSRCAWGPRSTRPSRGGEETPPTCSLLPSGWPSASRRERGRRERAPRGAASVRPDGGPRLPLPRLGGPGRRPQAGRAVLGAVRRALRPAQRRREPARAGAARDPPPRPVGVLPAPPRHARAGARGGPRGARAGVRPAAAAAGPRARLERVLDRLLPHRPLAHRPDRERALPGPLPERGAHRAARHRPRLPARHPRRPDPARARPLRARPLRARGGLLDLPRALRGARLRQGAGAAAGGDRAPGAGGRPLEGAQRHRGRRPAPGRPRAALAALGRPREARPRRLGAAPPPVAAPRRHGHLDPAADRPLPGAARLARGPPDGAVGQGLLRRRRLPQDRPARPGDALGGRALRGRDRARARRAHRPVAHPLRRQGGLRPHPGGGDDGRVPDRVARADADAEAHPAGEPRRHHRAGGAGAARADPGRRGPPLHRAAQGAAGGPWLRGAIRAPLARAGAARHARRDRLPGPGAGGGRGLRGLPRRRGRGAAPGDEPQALRGGDPCLRAEVHRRGDRARRLARVGRTGLEPDRGLLGLRLPQGALGRLRAARLPVDLAARALPPRVPLRAAERAADGLLPARLARARGAAQGGGGAAAVRGAELARSAGWREAPSGSGSAT